MPDSRIRTLVIALVAGLVLWGGYVTIAWARVPAHRAVLAEAADAATPLRWFITTLAAAYLAFVLLWCRRSPGAPIRIRFSPLGFALAFAGVIWLLFTSLALGDNAGRPYRRVLEPTRQAYGRATPDALAALQVDFERLQARGCLRGAGVNAAGAREYDLRLWCVQQAFVTRVLSPLLVVTALAVIVLGLGSLVLRLTGWTPPTLAAEGAVASALGAGGLIVLLWGVAWVGLFTAPAIWMLLALVTTVSSREILAWARRLHGTRWDVAWRWTSLQPVLAGILIVTVAFNFLTVIRPFPIGWDDTALYLNKSRLLVSYGHLIPQMGTFQWEYLTALGYALFGYDSAFAATTAMAISWAGGVLAAFSIYVFAAWYLPRGALLATVLYATLPMVGQFSFADMKIDNAVFAAGTLALFSLFVAILPESARDAGAEPSSQPHRRAKARRSRSSAVAGNATVDEARAARQHVSGAPGANVASPSFDRPGIVVAGLLAGLAFSLKPTAAMLVVTAGVMLAGMIAGWSAFVAGAAFGCALLAGVQLDLAATLARVGLPSDLIGPSTLVSLLTLLGLMALAWTAMRRRTRLAPLASGVGAYASAVLLVIAPWLVANHAAAGGSRFGLLLEPPNRLSAVLDLRGTIPDTPGLDIRRLPPDLALDVAGCRATGRQEELDRYWGSGEGWAHYATLPWRTVMNLDSTGYHVTLMPALLIVPLVVLLPAFRERAGAWLRWLMAGTLLLILQWIVFANGVPWYGIAMFLGLSLGLAALVVRGPTRSARLAAAAIVGVSILFNLVHREWQYGQMRNHYEYAIGKVSAEAAEERVIPHYDVVRDHILARAESMPGRPFAYRVGTFIAYFVPRNLDYLPLADNQLDVFACLNHERDPSLTLRRLQALGFNSLIFDTTTSSIEANPEGSLHRKVEAFLAFVNTRGLGLDVVINDIDGGVTFLLLP